MRDLTMNFHIVMGGVSLKTNMVLNGVDINGVVDGLTLVRWSGITLRNCRFHSYNDTLFDTYTLGSNSLPCVAWSCDFISEDIGIASGLIHNCFPQFGSFTFNNCSMISSNGNVQTYCFFSGGSSGKTILNGVTMLYGNTNGGPAAGAIFNSSTYQVQGSYFDLVLNRMITLDPNGSGKPVNSIRTNFVSGQVYTNTYGSTISISAKASLTTASIVGAANMCLEMLGNETNVSGMNTIVGTIVQTYTNILSGIVTNNGTYTFTNRSTGAGNSSSVSGGQILVK